MQVAIALLETARTAAAAKHITVPASVVSAADGAAVNGDIGVAINVAVHRAAIHVALDISAIVDVNIGATHVCETHHLICRISIAKFSMRITWVASDTTTATHHVAVVVAVATNSAATDNDIGDTRTLNV